MRGAARLPGSIVALVSLSVATALLGLPVETIGSRFGGIPQALPGEKMASAGDDWATNPATQITWGLGYITDRYGTPCGAWAHSEAVHWY